jgi:hypothetical protein
LMKPLSRAGSYNGTEPTVLPSNISTFDDYPATRPSPNIGEELDCLKPKQREPLRMLFSVVSLVILLGGIAAAWFWLRAASGNMVGFILLLVGAAIVAAVIAFGGNAYLDHRRGTPDENQELSESARARTRQLSEMEMNQRSLEQYQKLTQRQTKTSYRSAQVSIFLGFLILLGGAGYATSTGDTTAQVIVGSLAAIGSSISGYIGATSIRMYQRAQAQMNFYYAQPLVQSYILQAVHLTKQLDDNNRKDSAVEKIIGQTLQVATVAATLIRGNGSNAKLVRGDDSNAKDAKAAAST